ncbi:glycosyltransferase [Limosilactobacillus reuteri]|uniref:glycosyltransferase n=1 Tax=Limosilactobacillus reuteri TaxID=1598 RepID=UPI001E2BB5DF|nr:glycosyltransferase [Limosilactobacillus reuteri]MCC4383832.1 glycosyltransferase [Limosilactobacillus reuteri]MCC4418910.1 glycosyltransferase [Limosilactobacillus reuteri]MCC4422108.1 glycosyltransferase [Limosilactobacillus reuteri]
MKLKFICAPASGNGGTETVLVKALNHLCQKYQIELFLTTIPENRVWLKRMNERIKIHEIKNENKFAKLKYLSQIFLFSKSTDHFIILGANTIKLASKIRKLTRKKYSITSWIHYSLINQDMFNPKNIKLADNHLAISTPIKNQLKNLGINDEKISLIFNPVSQYDGKLNQLNNSEELKLVYVGKIMLDGQKNLRELFDGIKKYPKDIRLDLFGADNTNGEVQEYVKKLGIDDKCVFHGWTKDPWNIILNEVKPNALVLTSKYEGLPMVMIEAMSRGIPCIVADFSGYEDVITPNNSNGMVYHQGNITNFVDKLTLLSNKNYVPEKVKDSISKFYSNNYNKRLDNTLAEYLSEKKC